MVTRSRAGGLSADDMISVWLRGRGRAAERRPYRRGVNELVVHELKVDWEFFEDLASGVKEFEIRKNDRGFELGDVLALNEINMEGQLTGRTLYKKINYILADTRFLQDGYMALGIRHIDWCNICKNRVINFCAEPCYSCVDKEYFKLDRTLVKEVVG